MSESQAVKPVKFDFNDPTAVLPDDEIVINPDSDAFAQLAPVPDGTHIAAIGLSQQGWQKGISKDGRAYAMANIEAVIQAPGEKFDKGRVFDSASTMVMQSTDTSRIAGITKAAGDRPPARSTLPETVRAFNDLLSQKPQVKVTTRWEGWCADCPGKGEKLGKVVIRGMNKFPQLSNGQHSPSVECPTCGGDVQAKAKITKYERV